MADLSGVIPGEWRGATTPVLKQPNVRMWEEPITFFLHCREGLFVLGLLLISLFGSQTGLLGPTTGEGSTLERLAWVLVPAVLAGSAYVLLVFRRGGWVTIDPHRELIVWRRPPRASGPQRSWRFDEIDGAEARPSFLSEAVRIRVDGHNLLLRVPKDAARDLAESLLQARNSG